MRTVDLIAQASERVGRRVHRLRTSIRNRTKDVRARVDRLLGRDTGPQADTARQERDRIEREIDEAGKESFPASDPPSWTSRGTC